MPIRDTIDRKRSFAGGVRGFKLGLTISALQENQQRIFEMFNFVGVFLGDHQRRRHYKREAPSGALLEDC